MEGRISKTEFRLKQHKSRLSGTEYIRKNGKMVEALPLPAKEVSLVLRTFECVYYCFCKVYTTSVLVFLINCI